MIIRPATTSDASAICAISNPIIRDTVITFTTCERLAPEVADEIAEKGPRFLVVEDQGTLVGFASFGPFRSGPGYAHTAEHSIQFARGARGMGYGRALMHSLEMVARKGGIRVLIAGISAANPDGIAFHAGIGFVEVGRLPQVGRKFERWLDLVLMQKNLG